MPVMFQVIDKINDKTLRAGVRFKGTLTDTAVFRLHYKYTVIIVVIYSLLHVYVNFKSTFSCLGSLQQDKETTKAAEEYCWATGTYSVRNSNDSRSGEVSPGVRPFTGADDQKIVYHHYYKWIYFFIFYKILSLHFPRFVWLNLENGVMKRLTSKLKNVLIIETDETKKRLDEAAEYFFQNLGNHTKYAYGLVLCEILNVVVATILLLVWDYITEHELSLLATESTWSIFKEANAVRRDPLTEIFPKLGKCNFRAYGPSGSMETHDFICVLPMNVVNERAAIFFWYYFIVLVTIGSIQVIFRGMLILFKCLRSSLLSSLSPITTQDEIDLIIENSSYSDWFIMNLFGLNVEPIVYRKMLQMFVEKLKARKESRLE